MGEEAYTMKSKILLMLLLPLILFMGGCNANNEKVKIPSDWILGGKPEKFSAKWNYANRCDDISISLDDGLMTAKTYEWKVPFDYLVIDREQCRCTRCNGIFVGYNYGEFGGGLIFIPIDGSEYRVFDEKVRGFFAINDRIYVLIGLAHLGFSYGSIYELVCVGDIFEEKWEVVEILDICYAPEAFILVNNILYIATSDTLIAIKDGKISDTLVENAFWRGLYPNSMVYANNSIFIGMRSGVYVYELETGLEKWYDVIP